MKVRQQLVLFRPGMRVGREFMRSHSSFRIHLTNIQGAGALELLKSLLPHLVSNKKCIIDIAYVRENTAIQQFCMQLGIKNIVTLKCKLPNALSRVWELLFSGKKFLGDGNLLVMGDMPIKGVQNQIVFVQNSHLLKPEKYRFGVANAKYLIMRKIFELNIKYPKLFIVQTELMRRYLSLSYPVIADKIKVISQPPPEWLKKTDQNSSTLLERKLRLIYPAKNYPHKNHRLLSKINVMNQEAWPIDELVLTIDKNENPTPNLSWVKCIGALSSIEMNRAYEIADAIVFLSKTESYGFPLLEAMFLGLPIVCPNLEYARQLCGDQAIYFDHEDIESFQDALSRLSNKLSGGWRPDWSLQLEGVPTSWEETADKFIDCFQSPIEDDIH